MEEKLSGIVLFSVNYGESDKILTVFTLEQGVVSAKIKGVKKAGAKLKFASEPFCFAEFLFSNKNGRRTVTGASLIDSFYQLREDIVKYYAGSTVLEYLRKFLKENIISPEIFMLAIESLKELAYSQTSQSVILAHFLINALRLSGYALDLTGCHKCGQRLGVRVWFDYETGGFYDQECKTDVFREINGQTYLELQEVEKKAKPDVNDAVKALRLLDYYITNKTEENINSLKELNKILK